MYYWAKLSMYQFGLAVAFFRHSTVVLSSAVVPSSTLLANRILHLTTEGVSLNGSRHTDTHAAARRSIGKDSIPLAGCCGMHAGRKEEAGGEQLTEGG